LVLAILANKLKPDLTSVTIYLNYFSLILKHFIQKKIIEIDLLANIGATLGICLTSVVQVFDTAISLIKICVQYCRN